MTAREATIDDFIQSYSDFHKDAHGFRPRTLPHFTTLAEWQAEFDYLATVIEEGIADDKRREAAALERFDARLDDLMALLGQDRATVLRWLMDADKVDTTCPQSVGCWYYSQGLATDVRRMALIYDHGFTRKQAFWNA